VYDRNYAGKKLNFEPSGGLMNASLVMQDKQTDTYWSIMSGRAEAGELGGSALIELPVGEKMSWAQWHAKHPDTLVLSVTRRMPDGRTVTVQDPGTDGYGAYFSSDKGFRGAAATDARLETKDQIHAFLHAGLAYAIDLRGVAGGASFKLHDGTSVFIFRDSADAMFRGSAAFLSKRGFDAVEGAWVERATGARFDVSTRDFGEAGVERLNGFDTFWYTWSLTHRDTKLLQ